MIDSESEIWLTVKVKYDWQLKWIVKYGAHQKDHGLLDENDGGGVGARNAVFLAGTATESPHRRGVWLFAYERCLLIRGVC